MTKSSGKTYLKLIASLLLAATVLFVVITAMSFFHVWEIENKLQQEIASRLEQAGFEPTQFRVEGRIVTFTGNVDARIDREQMVTIVKELEGVDQVLDQRIVTNYATGKRFELHSYAGITTVEGELPSRADIELVINAIRGQYGVDPLGADLQERRAVKRPPWLDKLPKILEDLNPASPLKLDYFEQTLSISGTVPDANVRGTVSRKLKATLGQNGKLVISLKLANTGKSAHLRIEHKHGMVTLSGTIPDEGFVKELSASLSLAFATENIDNRLKIDPKVQQDGWLDGVLQVIYPLAVTHWVELDVKADEVVVRGQVRDDTELQIVNEQLREHFGFGTKIVNLVSKAKNGG